MAEFSLVQKIIINAVPIIFAITVHEVAHGWVASKLGDQTARMRGRLTLNPIKHIDPIGTILVPVVLLLVSNFIFGWAKPVPVDYRNLRRPKQDMAWVAIAGPAANLLMMVLWVLVAKIIISIDAGNSDTLNPLVYMALAGTFINIVLMVLNLIPLPPLDGSRVLSSFLPASMAIRYNKLEPFGIIILVLLLVSGIFGDYFWPLIIGLQNRVEALIF